MKRLATLALGAFLASACADSPLDPPAVPEASETPTASAQAPAGAIPGEYIVVFRPSVADAPGLARRLSAAHGGEIRFTYQHALKGFAASLPEAAVNALRANPNVAYVEPDAPMWAIGTQTNPPSWGLDRVDDENLPLDGTYTYGPDGSGVTAYIIDTGIRISHDDFGGRASAGFDAFGGDASDCNGHGTHVAGTTGGTEYGIAKNVALVAVRVLDCNGSGTVSGVAAGIDWVTGNADFPAVANMSLGGGASSTIDQAVRGSIRAGVTYALAAGNATGFGPFVSPNNSCDLSPSRVGADDDGALTVGATTSSDNEASFSNYGTCIDILAPGQSITSAWAGSDTDAATISGTSMAAPHVAGAAALYLSANPGATTTQVEAALVSNGIANTINLHSLSSNNGTPNLMLYTGFMGEGDPEPDPDPTDDPPTVSITSPSGGETVSGTVSVMANASDDFGVTQVEFFVDGGSIGVDTDGSNGWSASWNTADDGDGGHTVSATATDTNDQTASDAVSVTVDNSANGGDDGGTTDITLSATGSKVRGMWSVQLEWSGATTDVEIYRDGSLIGTGPSEGTHTDSVRGGESHTYQVCEAGTTTCSNEATAS